MQERLNAIDGLRGLAASGIVLYHVAELSPNRLPAPLFSVTERLWLGVPLFFVLSGFLLYRPFAAATINGRPWPSLRRYGRARFLRIFPAYWAVLTCTVLVLRPYMLPFALLAIAIALAVAKRPYCWFAVPVAVVSTAGIGAALDHAWAAVANYLLVYMTTGPYGIVGPAWSLCFEISFYAVLPVAALVVHVVARRSAATQRGRALVAVAVFALVGLASVGYLETLEPSHRLHLPAYLDWFIAGMLVAIAHASGLRSHRSLLPAAAALAIVALPLADVGRVSYAGNGTGVLYGALMAGAFALLVAAAALPHSRAARALACAPLAGLGRVSFGIFLWHGPVIETLQRYGGWSASTYVNLLTVGAVTALLTTASWHLIEKRALARKDVPLFRRRESVQLVAVVRA